MNALTPVDIYPEWYLHVCKKTRSIRPWQWLARVHLQGLKKRIWTKLARKAWKEVNGGARGERTHARTFTKQTTTHIRIQRARLLLLPLRLGGANYSYSIRTLSNKLCSLYLSSRRQVFTAAYNARHVLNVHLHKIWNWGRLGELWWPFLSVCFVSANANFFRGHHATLSLPPSSRVL